MRFGWVMAFLAAACGQAQVEPGSMNVHWDEGARDCAANPRPPIQVHAYNARTFILRENLCATFEAPFMYLLIGSQKAMLIDSGDVADPRQAPLAKTVMDLLPGTGTAKIGLLVVHTHRHLDHRAGDAQFQGMPIVQVVGFELDSVRRFYGFATWPNGVVQIDLGGRMVDAIPAPGHNETEVCFYDRATGLLFSGDFLMPGRLLIDDTAADLASAERVASFVRDRPVSNVLGGHIEKNTAGETYSWGSQYHPNEHVLQMSKADLEALPAAIRGFNGIYSERGQFILMNSMRVLALEAVAAVVVIAGLAWWLVRTIRRRRRRRLQALR